MSKEVKELLFRLDIVPQSRDRRPRLSAYKSLINIPLAYILSPRRLGGAFLNSFLTKAPTLTILAGIRIFYARRLAYIDFFYEYCK